jgi:hypothetical protein
LLRLLQMAFQFEPFITGDDGVEAVQPQDVDADVVGRSFGAWNGLQ